MERTIQEYMNYLHNVKKVSHNTEISYRRDLQDAARYFAGEGVTQPVQITDAHLAGYMRTLEEEGLSSATISRRVSALRSFFHFLKQENTIGQDPSAALKAPKAEHRKPAPLTAEEAERLLEQPDRRTLKGIRDRAMLMTLCETGIRVSELVHLQLSDLDLKRNYIVCRRGVRERRIFFQEDANKALAMYLEHARDIFLKGKESSVLFANCAGGSMSRQGFWKILKDYAKEAEITKEITPQTLAAVTSYHIVKVS